MIDLSLVKQAQQALNQGNPFAAMEYLDSFAGLCGSEMTDEAILNEAEAIERKKHLDEVAKAAAVIFDDWKAGNFSGSKDELQDALNNCAEICHYNEAQRVLIHSDNAEAGMHENGDFDCSGGIPWCELAYYAFRADVMDTLHHKLDNALHHAPPKEPVEKCDNCDEWKPKRGFKDCNCEDCKSE